MTNYFVVIFRRNVFLVIGAFDLELGASARWSRVDLIKGSLNCSLQANQKNRALFLFPGKLFAKNHFSVFLLNLPLFFFVLASAKIWQIKSFYFHWDVLQCTCVCFKFRRITRPHFAIQKKLANRVLFGVEYYVESGVTTRLKL